MPVTEGDHIKITASKYPFPTVCADQQSTDWFLSISRTLKWNERERQKSFVVVEENVPPQVRKSKYRSFDTIPPPPAADTPEEEDSEEEEKFDIDDSAPEADAGITDTNNVAGIEKLRKLTLSSRKRSKSRSRSRSRVRPVSGVLSPSRYATKPPFFSSRHVDFEVPSSPSSTSSDSLLSDVTHGGTGDYVRSAFHQSAKSRVLKDRDLDFDHIKTPTLGHHGHLRTRNSQPEPRVFAVRGQDESDSATSDG